MGFNPAGILPPGHGRLEDDLACQILIALERMRGENESKNDMPCSGIAKAQS